MVLLGVLAAVALPKFGDLQEQARIKSARAAVGEVKSRLSQGYGQQIVVNGAQPGDTSDICSAVNDFDILPTPLPGNVNLGPEYVVTLSQVAGGKTAKIKITSVNGKVLDDAVVENWKLID